jgi:hypothetical protein
MKKRPTTDDRQPTTATENGTTQRRKDAKTRRSRFALLLRRYFVANIFLPFVGRQSSFVGRRIRQLRTYFIFSLLLLLLSAGVTYAQELVRTEAFVYGVNASVPGAVMGTFAPPSVETVYLMADQTSILSPRRTLVYFWPITNEYRAAWSQMNEEVVGTLEVMQGGRVVTTVEQTDYTIHFTADGGEMGPKPQLYMGAEATEANTRFQEEQAAYQQAALDYQQAREAWLAVGREIQQQNQDGGQIELPPAPEPPTPFNVYSTGLNRGYPIDLEAGTYEVRTRLADGTVVPESVRRLVVFEPRRTAVGYKVIPESRWTFPEDLNDLSDIILGERGSVLYLQPQVIREYPELAYERLQNPQYPGDTTGAEWEWVGGEPLEDGVIEIVQNGRVVDRRNLEPYFVKQVPGRQLGYEILPYDEVPPEDSPRVDFEGYRIVLEGDLPAYQVRLLTAEGDVVVGSEREVRMIPGIDLRLMLLLPLVPILGGAALLFWRRQQITRIRLAG